MNTSIVIPYQHSRWNDIEIKFALRSVEKHISGYGDVFIVGDKPRSLKGGYIHLPGIDDTRNHYKERNIFQKIFDACLSAEVTDTFLWMDDDHFFSSEYQAVKFPAYCHLQPKRRADLYQQTIDNTLSLFPTEKVTYFNLHCPMVYEKQLFVESLGKLNWEKKAGYCIQTAYMKMARPREKGEMYADMKIRYQYPINELLRMITGRKWFSICDGARGPELEALIGQLYPNKSRFE